AAVAVAVTFVWLGMVLAISFLEAPLKFRAPGLELRVGLAIGRIVFRALNTAEAVWAIVVAAMLIVHTPSVLAAVAGCTSIAVLAVQLLLVRPRLNRHSDRVLAGEDAPRSRSHHAYIAAETGKVTALAVLAAALLATL
ncbi:MAG TPA: hypothetical protein VGM10_18545, partial [Actinocrinis sp.]